MQLYGINNTMTSWGNIVIILLTLKQPFIYWATRYEHSIRFSHFKSPRKEKIHRVSFLQRMNVKFLLPKNTLIRYFPETKNNLNIQSIITYGLFLSGCSFTLPHKIKTLAWYAWRKCRLLIFIPLGLSKFWSLLEFKLNSLQHKKKPK